MPVLLMRQDLHAGLYLYSTAFDLILFMVHEVHEFFQFMHFCYINGTGAGYSESPSEQKR